MENTPPMAPSQAAIAGLLRREYGIAPLSVVDAPRGFVAETFDVRTADGRRFFVKWLPVWADADALARGLPMLEELRAFGIDTVSHAIRTTAGALTAELDARMVIVFDFVEGRTATPVDAPPPDPCLEPYVALLARIHRATARVTSPLPREMFELPWAGRFEELLARALDGLGAPPVRAELRRLMRGHRGQMAEDWAALLSLARDCRRGAWEAVITHGDGALGSNVIVGSDGRVYLLDWDVPLLGPRERDTWFFLNDDATAADFLRLYREVFPDYGVDPALHRFYVVRRFFEDLTGYLDGIAESPSPERQRWHLGELQQTCFEWLWPAMRRLDAAG